MILIMYTHIVCIPNNLNMKGHRDNLKTDSLTAYAVNVTPGALHINHIPNEMKKQGQDVSLKNV